MTPLLQHTQTLLSMWLFLLECESLTLVCSLLSVLPMGKEGPHSHLSGVIPSSFLSLALPVPGTHLL